MSKKHLKRCFFCLERKSKVVFKSIPRFFAQDMVYPTGLGGRFSHFRLVA